MLAMTSLLTEHFGPQQNIMVFLSLGHNSVTKAHPHQQGAWTWI